jgi:hypothetical protein
MKPRDTKGKWQPKKIKWYKGMIKLVTQYSYFGKKPNKYWVDFKTTHQLDGAPKIYKFVSISLGQWKTWAC